MQYKEIIIELSHNCNLACRMCGFGHEVNPVSPDKFMKEDLFYKLVNELAPHTKVLRLNGRGESTIHPGFEKMVTYVHEKYPQVAIYLFSNMSFKSDKILNVLMNSQVQLFISFDSVQKDILEDIRFGADYNKIISNIELLKDYPVRPFIVMTLQEKNITEIYEIGCFAKEHNCSIIFNTVRSNEKKYIQGFIDKVEKSKVAIAKNFENVFKLYALSENLQCLYPNQMAGIKLPIARHSTKTHGSMNFCPAIENELCILYDGAVTPCNMFNPYIYGNIKENSMEEILNSDKYLNFKKSFKKDSYCKDCANMGV